MNCGSGKAAVVSPVDLEGEGGFTALFVGDHHRLRRGVALAEDDLLVCVRVRVCVCACVRVCVRVRVRVRVYLLSQLNACC